MSSRCSALLSGALPALPLALRRLGDCVLQLPFDMWEGKLYHVEFALQAKLKSQAVCVIILSHCITMKCHGTMHYTDSENASEKDLLFPLGQDYLVCLM